MLSSMASKPPGAAATVPTFEEHTLEFSNLIDRRLVKEALSKALGVSLAMFNIYSDVQRHERGAHNYLLPILIVIACIFWVLVGCTTLHFVTRPTALPRKYVVDAFEQKTQAYPYLDAFMLNLAAFKQGWTGRGMAFAHGLGFAIILALALYCLLGLGGAENGVVLSSVLAILLAWELFGVNTEYIFKVRNSDAVPPPPKA